MTTATHDIDSVSHIRQLLDTAKATQRPSDARLVDEALRMLEAEELLAVSERRVQIDYRLKGGVSHDALAKLRVWVDEAKRTQRSTDIDMVRGALTVIEAEETLAKIVERAERRRQTASLPPGYDYASAAHDMFAAPPPGHEWTDDSKTEVREVHRHGTGPARPLDHAWSVYMGCEDPPGFCSRDALDAGEVNSIVVARNNAWAKFRATQNCDFFFKAPDGRVYGPYVNKASMHGDAWTHATDPDLFIAPTPGADELLTPEEYEAALASDLSETDLYHIIDRAMSEALEFRSPFFRVSVPSSALERAKAMLVKWDVQETGRPVMRERGSHLVHLKVSPKPPAFEVFLVGDLVVVAEDVDNATILGNIGLQPEEARQVDSSEALSVWLWDDGPHTENRGATITKTAGEWAKSSGRGVLGPISGSPLDTSRVPRVHLDRCDGVPCYCDDAREHGPFQLYFVGPSLYVAASEDDAAVLHTMSMADAEEKLQELLDLVQAGLSNEVAAHTKGFLDQLVTEIRKPGVPVLVDSEQPLPAIIEYRNDGVDALGLEGRMLLSTNTYAQWVELGRGSHGVLQSFYEESVMPQVEALLPIAAELGIKRIIETRNRLTVTREDNGENHLYFIGPNLYVAESEEAALKYHRDGVIDNTAKLEELRQSILEEAPSEVEMASRHVDAVFAEVSKDYVIRRVDEDEALPEIVEFSDKKEAVQVSSKTYNDWRSGKMGSVGLLRSYYQEVITPHVEAIMAAAAVAGERRLQEVREKLGIGDSSGS